MLIKRKWNLSLPSIGINFIKFKNPVPKSRASFSSWRKHLPTVVTHAIVAIAGGKIFPPHDKPRYFWLLSIICVVLPDVDVVGYTHFYIPYDHFWGHRGFLHSPIFAFLLSGLIVCIFFQQQKFFSKSWWQYVLYFFVLTASHGVLDAFTDGGYGVALLSPFDNTRYFFRGHR